MVRRDLEGLLRRAAAGGAAARLGDVAGRPPLTAGRLIDRSPPSVPWPYRSERHVKREVLRVARQLGLDLDVQNTGGFRDSYGHRVRFGTPGNSDLAGVLPGGRALHVELKREGFDPAKASKKDRERFDLQVSRLQRTNLLGGVGFWIPDALLFLDVMLAVLHGARVEELGHRLTVFPPEDR